MNNEVNLGCFTHFAIFFIAFFVFCISCDISVIRKDVHYIREQIENDRIEITYRDSVAVDSVVVYKMK